MYLSDELKEALADAAGRSGRSEADVIRGAIELAVQHKRSRSVTAGEDAASELAGVIAELHGRLLHAAVESID